MNKERYVLNLKEDSSFGSRDSILIGYWDGKKYKGDDVSFPGVIDNKHDKRVKVYTSKKLAENAVKKLKDKFSYVSDAQIELLD
jgi:hypothetical protein